MHHMRPENVMFTHAKILLKKDNDHIWGKRVLYKRAENWDYIIKLHYQRLFQNCIAETTSDTVMAHMKAVRVSSSQHELTGTNIWDV